MKLAKIGSIFAAALLVSGMTGCWKKAEAPAENAEQAPPAEAAPAAPAEGAPAEAAPAAPAETPAQ